MTCESTVPEANPSATQVLKDEHRVIEKVLDATEQVLWDEPLDKEFFSQAQIASARFCCIGGIFCTITSGQNRRLPVASCRNFNWFTVAM